jgi:hypothetical protein
MGIGHRTVDRTSGRLDRVGSTMRRLDPIIIAPRGIKENPPVRHEHHSVRE